MGQHGARDETRLVPRRCGRPPVPGLPDLPHCRFGATLALDHPHEEDGGWIVTDGRTRTGLSGRHHP